MSHSDIPYNLACSDGAPHALFCAVVLASQFPVNEAGDARGATQLAIFRRQPAEEPEHLDRQSVCRTLKEVKR